tara:strand:+ start:126 stop:500 length:375 start_codon:yes stop_codon:yes gene_type:complete
MTYEEGAKEVLRLLALFEDRFSRQCSFYCTAEAEIDGLHFRWNPRARQIQYRESYDEQWVHAGRVFHMEVPGIVVENIQVLYDACVEEQSRVSELLSKASSTGNSFADMLLHELNGDVKHAGNQ